MASEIRVTNIKANDGTASLTVANSTGNVSVGGTLTSTGAITASGGIANAGTISAGTLGSSVVFPAGHVIQTVYNSFNNGNSNTITSSTTSKFTSANTSGEEYKAQISNLTSGNDVLIHFNFVGSIDRSDYEAGGSFAIYRDSTIIYEGTDDLQMFVHTTTSTGSPQVNRNIMISNVSILYMDESPSSTSHTYFVGGSSKSATGVMIRSSSGYAPFTAILQEIVR